MSNDLTGVIAEAYEYRRYQSGAQWFWTPLRFPGHYYDPETDLAQNWNRFCDAAVDRFSAAEPYLLTDEAWRHIKETGAFLPAYAYSESNPLFRIDEDGLLDTQEKKDGTPNPIVRRIEEPLRSALLKRCKQERDESLKECNHHIPDKCTPLPKHPSRPDLHRYDDQLAKAAADCETGAECHYEACVADAESGYLTTEFVRALARCFAGSSPR